MNESLMKVTIGTVVVWGLSSSLALADPQLPDAYSGTIIVHETHSNQDIGWQSQYWDRMALPASTFKVPHSVIALETGVIPETTTVLPWDGKTYGVAAWNRDHSFATALSSSCVPCYQSIARQIGPIRMQAWLRELSFGTMHPAEQLDRFWLEGSSRISPRQQTRFLKRLALRQLPVSERSQNVVETMLLQDTGPGWRLYAKTGWAGYQSTPEQTGWYVGYLKSQGKTYTFATQIQATDPDPAIFGPLRRQITLEYLREQKLLP